MNPPALTPCIPLDALAMYLQGGAAQREKTPEIARHLASGCAVCATNERWLAKAVQLARADHSFALSPEAIANVVAHFKAQTAAQRPTLRELIAQLVFDSFGSMQLAPARQALAGGTAVSRQVLYHVEGYDIDLRFEPAESAGTEELLGQVMAATQAVHGLTVQLWREGELAAQTMTDADGYFRLAPLAAGTYDLRLQVSEGEIQINGVSTAQA